LIATGKREKSMPAESKLAAQTTHYAMGTVMSHKAFGVNAESCLKAVSHEITRMEALLSRFLPDSDISRINGAAGIQSEVVSQETYEVLSKSVEFSRRYPGYFDVTIEPLVTLWRHAKDSFALPSQSAIEQTLSLVDYRDLELDAWEMTVGLANIGQSVDLGGIGKGFTGDRILEVYKSYGITSAYSNLGGNVMTLGTKPDGSLWHIGIQHPREEIQLIGVVAVENQTVVTSGDYQRYFSDDQGKRYHHILDPKRGYPAESGLISVSIVAETSVAADALSTIIFVAGLEKGIEILRDLRGTEAILVDNELRVFVTQGLINRFEAAKGVAVTFLN
jgi:thiamine biosynthesis lipoprotein